MWYCVTLWYTRLDFIISVKDKRIQGPRASAGIQNSNTQQLGCFKKWIFFLIALCPIFHTQGMTPKYIKNWAQCNWKKKIFFFWNTLTTIHVLEQEEHKSYALAMELHLSCTNPSKSKHKQIIHDIVTILFNSICFLPGLRSRSIGFHLLNIGPTSAIRIGHWVNRGEFCETDRLINALLHMQ